MIFVTAGTQEPFDRLIKDLDEIIPLLGINVKVQSRRGIYKPVNFGTVDFLSESEFEELIDHSRLIIAHAGMGTVINCLLKKKPLIIYPRLFKLGEHRNDHQLSSVRKLKEFPGIEIAWNKEQLLNLLKNQDWISEISSAAKPDFSIITDRTRQFIGI